MTNDHTIGVELTLLAVTLGLLFSFACHLYDRYRARRRARRLRTGPSLTLPRREHSRWL